jgi:hypothetical protein
VSFNRFNKELRNMGWNWKSTLAWMNDLFSVVERVSYLAVYVASISALTSVVLAHFKLLAWAFGFMALGVLGLAIYFISQREKERSDECTNPNLIIVRDLIQIEVGRNFRTVQKSITLKSTRRVDEYHFKVFWTGSTEEVKVSLINNDVGRLQRELPTGGLAYKWRPYSIKFHEPIQRGKVKHVELQYHADDPQGIAEKFQIMRYLHVKKCEMLECHILFEPDYDHGRVYLVKYDGRDVARPKEEIIEKVNGYRIELQPERGMKYSIEWGET